jgi:2-polyprenyl-6-methoxyphenol hydroxylase-like FAD-dependent oxidoreductase
MALGLAHHGVRSVVVEREAGTSRHSRAPGIHVRTLEVLRRWGIDDRFRAEGSLLRQVHIHAVEPDAAPLLALDFSPLDVEADRPGLLVLAQSRTEQILLEAVRATGMCDVRFGTEAVALVHTAAGARLTVRDVHAEHRIDADFVIGCDGAGSFVRDAVGLPFEGRTYSLRPMLADVEVSDARDDLPWPRAWPSPDGFAFAARLEPGLWRLVHIARGEPESESVEDAEVQHLAERLLGDGPAPVVWASRFRIHIRAAPRFRVGRVLLAGDAAHVHSPASGFGMNGGIQDAHNLGWKVACALAGGDMERLLESYDIERRAVVVEDTARYTDLITRLFLQSPAFVRTASFALLRRALRLQRFERAMLRRLAMFDLEYPASPLLGDDAAAGVRLPNVLLRRGTRRTRIHDLLPNGPAIIELATEPTGKQLPVQQVLHVGPGSYEDMSGLLHDLLGGRDGWILVRPDGCVAWARHDSSNLAAATRYALGQPPR